MTELMKRYESETGECATWTWHEREFLTDDYIAWLEAKANISDEAIKAFQKIIRNQCDEITALKEKAEAYDRLMSGEVKTLKDMANIFKMYSAIDKDGYARLFADPPFIDRNGWSSKFPEDEWSIPGIIDFSGDWKDSLTLPDGWEEK